MRTAKLILIILVGLLVLAFGAAAQDDGVDPLPSATPRQAAESTAEATAEPAAPRLPRAEVDVESAFVRVLPVEDAEPVASVFEDESLEVVGRSLDGFWLEVRRPYRMTNLGWIYYEMLDYDFERTSLPLTELRAGATGTQILTRDPGYAVEMIENANLRSDPTVANNAIGLIPIFAVVPVIYRNQDGTWLYVSYLGTEGWVSNYNFSAGFDVMTLAVKPGLPPLPSVNVFIIPPEIQLEQVQRLREYITVQRDVSIGLSGFWFTVSRGTTMPCEPPPFVLDYLYTPQDVRELPELQRIVPRLGDANILLNTSIELLTVCGAFNIQVVMTARNSAINAANIFNAAVLTLQNVEDIIR